MKNRTIKILSALMVLLMVVSTFSMVFAGDPAKTKDYLVINEVKAIESDAAGSAQNITGMILGVVQVIAIAIAVIMLIVLAIKYISAAPAEKADIKKGMITYVVGAILLFGASGILQIIKTFAGNIK